MARYVVNVVAAGRTTSILVILSSSAIVLSLVDKIKARLPSLNLGITSDTNLELTLHINAPDGPILDEEDLLSDILPDSTKEQLFAVVNDPTSQGGSTVQSGPSKSHTEAQEKASGKKLRVRVITPELARSQPDVNSIPLLPENSVTLNSTLLELHAQVKEHLGLSFLSDEPRDHSVCNCAFARQIDENTALNELGALGAEAINSLVVVYDTNKVALIPVDSELGGRNLEEAARQHLEVKGKTLSVIGGLEGNVQQGNTKYLKLPVFAFCSPKRHEDPLAHMRAAQAPARVTILDLHTSEVPIRITSHNANLTLLAAGLEDSLINNVLNLYAVKRFGTTVDGSTDSAGKDAIFQRGLGWEHPLGRQSDRGLSNFLSSLRVFSELLGTREMEDSDRDSVLHVIHLLTRFPPAVRAFYTISEGRTPSDCECATICQCIYEVLKDVVPLVMVKLNPLRLFEGSRLLFGLILDKAKHLKTAMHEQEGLPYADAMKVQELRNMITMEPVSAPMQTMSGLVDRGFYDAFQGGPLRWTNDNDITATKLSDRKLQRVALLTGGQESQVVAFDIDTVNRGRRYLDGGDVDKVISATEYSDLHYLGSLCSQNKLGVLPPSSLPSADKNVLTLDRQGLLAVYVGRQSCAEAGRDISLFSPTSTPCVSGVDVAIVTQTLVPILNQRNSDGTVIFEAFGDNHRRIKDPDEIVMLVVDCSASMSERCGFSDVEANEDAYDPDDSDSRSASQDSDSIVEDEAYEQPTLTELKEFLATHESFPDMLAIVRSGNDDFHRTEIAGKVLQLLRGLAKQQIQLKKQELEDVRHRATQFFYRQKAQNITRDVATLTNRLLRLKQYNNLLQAFLLYRAENDKLDEPLTWTVGQTTVPRILKKTDVSYHNLNFEIPQDYLCPISAELMEDPVATIDGFVYERRCIDRWFKGHETSPCTNVKLSSFELRPNISIKQNIHGWINGRDIIMSKYQSTPESLLSVAFKSPVDKKTVSLPASITMEDLYQIAFRISKGQYRKFELHHRNMLLLPSPEPASASLSSIHDVFITPLGSATATSSSNETEDLCLVKIYCNSDWSVLPTVSYWEPKTTTKSLASVLFRYYREKFRSSAWTYISDPYVVWTEMVNAGDGKLHGHPQNHWESLSSFFNRQQATGRLAEESIYDKEDGSEEKIETNNTQPLVLKLCLAKPCTAHPDKRSRKMLTRLDLLKQMFDAWVNRLLAYNFQSHIGLVTIRSTATLDQEITHAVESFRHHLNQITASGDTALWDSIALAADQLKYYSSKYPNAKLRILALSDGNDTSSKQQVHNLSMRLLQDGVLLDSICLGISNHTELKTLGNLTGGYIFSPSTMEEAMAICEMEPVLCQIERPDVTLPKHARRYLSQPARRFRNAKSETRANGVTQDEYPKRKDHPGLSESYVELSQISRRFSVASRSDGNLRLSRIHNEIRNSGAKVHPHYDVYICESSFNLWKIVMQGPPGSSYASGTFLMYLEMGDDYPRAPPQGRFITPVYHPNINRHGRICHSILDRNWTIDTTNSDVINTIYSLLLVPEFSDPINAVVTLNFYWDEVQFKEEAEKHIAKYATKNRAQWKRDIVG
ncbi:hypothetical protein K505DRAFT_341133 [Melanomma pulvis-pyrius CBS 109.77]|uniref:peptidylprolyl isomerase n=1 Tax=Melanomma pulvis-pyrius CBS 109.77 TaxID=1314802 RepID=A0A6A6X097_9PLEO|nr:hypothetical protein K505DRAFT_341133 [Melanomma pulvis-pyrius CBS 109.77]